MKTQFGSECSTQRYAFLQSWSRWVHAAVERVPFQQTCMQNRCPPLCFVCRSILDLVVSMICAADVARAVRQNGTRRCCCMHAHGPRLQDCIAVCRCQIK